MKFLNAFPIEEKNVLNELFFFFDLALIPLFAL
jgi:hypothetical protein